MGRFLASALRALKGWDPRLPPYKPQSTLKRPAQGFAVNAITLAHLRSLLLLNRAISIL